MELKERLNTRCEEECFDVRWHVQAFRSELDIHRNGETEQWSASTRKVSVMMALLSHVERGTVSLNEKIIYTEELGKGVQSGTFRYMSPGFTFTLKDALANMIITSDNVCTGLVFAALGKTETEQIQAVNDYCRAIGMRNTVHRHKWLDTKQVTWYHTDEGMTTTSATDQVRLLMKIVDGSRNEDAAKKLGVTSEHCRFALTLMRRENGLMGMGALLPENASMASKGGAMFAVDRISASPTRMKSPCSQ